MKKSDILPKLLLPIMFLLNFATAARAEVRELSHMAEAVRFADPRTLVVFDLDNTVLEAKQMLGSDQFFGYLMDLAKAQGLDEARAKEWALGKASYVQPRTAVQAVEVQTPAFIHGLQRAGIAVMALTSRPAGWAASTLRQVRSLDVDFRPTAPHLYTPAMEAVGHFTDGVFFLTKNSNKGAAMLEILKQQPRTWNKILFIDDKAGNVASVEQALATTTLAHLSVRYGAADAKVASFRGDVARCEWQAFFAGHGFITDAEALTALRRGVCR
jgi:hypothetical protein